MNIKEYFEFSKRELNGLLVFCILLILVTLSPAINSYFFPPEVYDHSQFEKEIKLFKASAVEKTGLASKHHYKNSLRTQFAKPELFAFNPNNLPEADWKRLGLRDYQIRVIKNYESKGGRFYTTRDLKKIYSIKPEEFSRLEPYIVIPKHPQSYDRKIEVYKKASRPVAKIDINTADSIVLESINGIGPAFAKRIIKYRDRLGGFYKKEQLKEVYGLDSVLYQKINDQIIINPLSITQIYINNATFEDLKRHPYLSYKQMNAIIKYRIQHGDYKSIQDLKAIPIINQEVLDKIAPYFAFHLR